VKGSSRIGMHVCQQKNTTCSQYIETNVIIGSILQFFAHLRSSFILMQ
jgi:hypothetical protein